MRKFWSCRNQHRDASAARHKATHIHTLGSGTALCTLLASHVHNHFGVLGKRWRPAVLAGC